MFRQTDMDPNKWGVIRRPWKVSATWYKCFAHHADSDSEKFGTSNVWVLESLFMAWPLRKPAYSNILKS